MSQPEAGALPDPAEQPQGSSRPPAPQPSPPPPKHTVFPDPWLKLIWAGSWGNAYTAGGTKGKWGSVQEGALEEKMQGSDVEEFSPHGHFQQESGKGLSVRHC